MSQDLLMAPVRAWGACGVCLIHATRPRCTMTLARDPIPIRLDRWIHSFEVAIALSPQALSLLSPGLRPPEPYLAPTTPSMASVALRPPSQLTGWCHSPGVLRHPADPTD